ncbi:MAG: hypothetical protein ACREGA_00160 [Candidatus Saccharimonadales bacterium]
MKHYRRVIYLPGLGDDDFRQVQTRLINFWRVYKLKVDYHYIGWADKQAFRPKLDKIIAQIDECAGRGERVSLIGASAGASAAINAFVARSAAVDKVVLICGKIHNPQTIARARFEQNPAFEQSLAMLPASLGKLPAAERRRIKSFRPLADGVVPPKDTIIDGADKGLLPSAGHSFSIFYALSFGSFRLAGFIKQKAAG